MVTKWHITYFFKASLRFLNLPSDDTSFWSLSIKALVWKEWEAFTSTQHRSKPAALAHTPGPCPILRWGRWVRGLPGSRNLILNSWGGGQRSLLCVPMSIHLSETVGGARRVQVLGSWDLGCWEGCDGWLQTAGPRTGHHWCFTIMTFLITVPKGCDHLLTPSLLYIRGTTQI